MSTTSHDSGVIYGTIQLVLGRIRVTSFCSQTKACSQRNDSTLQGGKMDFSKRFILIFMLIFPVFFNIDCIAKNSSKAGAVQAITSVDQFNTIIENSGNQLIAFHLYADWCMPCRVLEPLLTEIAQENHNKIVIYKVDTDALPQIAEAFGVTGIPFVVFIKNQKAIYAMMGVQPKETYLRIIETYADTTSHEEKKPDEKKIKGLKVIKYRRHQIITDLIM